LTAELLPSQPGISNIGIVGPSGWQTGPDLSVAVRSSTVEFRTIPVAGKDTVRQLDYSVLGFSATALQNAQIRVTSSDPSKLLLSRQTDLPGSSSLILQGFFPSIYVHALSDSGTAEITARAETISGTLLPQSSPGTLSLRLVPSGWAFTQSEYIIGGSSPVHFSLSLSDLDPAASPGQRYALRPGVSTSVSFGVSDDSILDVRPLLLPISGPGTPSVQISGRKPGEASVTINAPPGFGVNPDANVLRVTVRQ
jgi:hypothetical protein